MPNGVWSVKEADADMIRIVVAGIQISNGPGQSGYADGEFLNMAPKRAIFESVEGTDGSVSWSRTNSRLWTVKLTLSQTSDSNATLSALTTLDQNAPNGAGIGSFVVDDLQGTTYFLATRSRIVAWPDMTFNRTSEKRVWVIEAVADQTLIGGN